MRNTVLRLAGAAAFAIMAGSVMSTPATAFVGLSDKQADEISEYIKCKTYLLKADLASFEADPDCGKGPVTIQRESMGTVSGAAPKKHDDYCYERPQMTLFAINIDEGDGGYCYAR